MKTYKGVVVGESLEDANVINEFNIKNSHLTDDTDPADRWHMYAVEATKEELEKLAHHIKPTKWYAHFWDSDKNVIAVFKDKLFEFNYDDKSSWSEAVEYGKSVGIPEEQLDFVIE